MIRRGLFLAAAMLASFAACNGSPPPSPPACDPLPKEESGLDEDTVWGFADLHAHPGIERAFGGRFIWGSATDEAPVDAAELPDIDPCPVETHDRSASSPLDRAVGAKVFPMVGGLAGFAHAPVGTTGYRPTNAWPNARDLIHQQMNVASIRRAYEGGLRLMFASTTDDQVVSALLSGPNFVNGFVPNPDVDYRSARDQIGLIQSIVARNSQWMELVGDPDAARAAIRSGRLAIVLSLEMEGLTQQNVRDLVREFGVSHIVPIHLVDNDVGGTAANGDIFNAASAAVSSIYRSDGKPDRYMDIIATPGYSHPLGWPVGLATLSPPLYVDLKPIAFQRYLDLCYEPLAACSGTEAEPRTFIEFGQQNLRGLCTTVKQCEAGKKPGVERIQDLIHQGLFVDLSHMSARSVEDTLAVDHDFPFIASHGDVAHLCAGRPATSCRDLERWNTVSERSLDVAAARAVLDRGGVLGFGTGVEGFLRRSVVVGRGGPLLTLAPGGPTTGCVARAGTDDSAAPGCERALAVDRADPTTPVRKLEITTVGGIAELAANAHPFARVELHGARAGDEYQRRVAIQPLTCTAQGCRGTIDLETIDLPTEPTPVTAPDGDDNPKLCDPLHCADAKTCGDRAYTIDDIESVTLEWLYLGCDLGCQTTPGAAPACASGPGRAVLPNQCSSSWDDACAPSWPLESIAITAIDGASRTPLAALERRIPTPIVMLERGRGAVVAYSREDRPTANEGHIHASGHLLEVALTSAPNGELLEGAGPARAGANICIAVRHERGGICRPTPAPSRDAHECPAAWTPLNQRGAWGQGAKLTTFVRSPEDESTVCGVDVAVLDFDPTSTPLLIDEVRISAIEDPVGRWVRRYAELMNEVALGNLGSIGIGTDFNGFNGMLEISEDPVPDDAKVPSSCSPRGAPDGGAPDGSAPDGQRMAPMRFRHADGSLGGEIRIDERGLATYGLLQDFMAIVKRYPGCGEDVHRSLMLSAEATLRTWEKIESLVHHKPMKKRSPLPVVKDFRCKLPPDVAP